MKSEGKSLMEIRSEAKENFMRVLSIFLGLPSIGIGVSLLYFGYYEKEYINLFFYFVVGLSLVFIGTQLIVSGIPTRRRRIKVKTISSHVTEQTTVPKCPKCGASITSAGKFCGNCGEPLR
jgi:hypothetical protein